MKIRFLLFALLPILYLSAGCRAQVPASPAPKVALTWTAASSCGGSNPACEYILSRAVCPTASTCPSAFTPLNQATPVSGTAYTDTPPTGTLVLYIAQTVQSSLTSVASLPSNGGTPTIVPALPTAPGAPAPTVQTAALAPPLVNQPLPLIVASVNLPQPVMLMATVRR